MQIHASVAALLPFFAACHLTLHDDLTVDGVRLPAHHEEILTVDSWPAEGLSIAAHVGDVRVVYQDGPTSITVEVHERTLGEAHARIEEGRLVARADNDATCALGRTLVRTRGPVQGLHLETGCGDVGVAGVQVAGKLALSTGMGDVTVHGAGRLDSIELDTRMGNISVMHTQCTRLDANTGMGDIRVDGVEASGAELSSGMGDVEVAHSNGSRIEADTGLGDIEFVESSFEAKDLDTGMGSIRSN